MTQATNEPNSESLTSDQPAFWETRYANESTPWDIDQPAPPFVDLIESDSKGFLPPGKMAVLGCGRGHDAGFFGQKGFDVIGFDFVPQAIEAAKARYGQWASFEQADIFQLDPKYTHQFDYVLEYTCFCAIRPTQRQAYVQTVSSLLKTGGKLLGLFWIHPQTGGPPYSTSEKELLDLFSPAFEVAQLSLAQNSWGDRQGEEYLGLFIKR